MRVEMTFNDAAVAAAGFRKEDICWTIKKAFVSRGLRCTSENELLSFEDNGGENDYAQMWNVIKSLMISDRFLTCDSSCLYIDDDDEVEDVLAQSYLFKKRSAV